MFFPFKGKRVLIFGLGTLGGGVGVAKFFAESGSQVTVTDLKTEKELVTSVGKLKKYKNINFVLGKHREEDFKKANLIIKNPAVKPDSPYLLISKKHKIPITTEAGIFFQLTPSKKIIGITGTKGKTTTTQLIYNFLKIAGLNVQTAGGPKTSMLAILKKITRDTFVVLELSSWQLQGLANFKISPQIAVITNIFPDHLNYYSSMDDYIADKEIIFEFQKRNDLLVTNFDNQITTNLAKTAKGRVIFFSTQKLAVWERGEEFIHFDKKELQKVLQKGEHNLANFLAAVGVGIGLKIDIFTKKVWSQLINFKLPEGRIELVREINGVKFYNDTTATTPEATIAALKLLDRPIILLCGGADKNLNYSKLAKIINQNQKVKAVVLLEGDGTDKIESRVRQEKILGRFSNFAKAIKTALNMAKKGDVILLSPACASFGMFKNEFDRGEQFKKIVFNL